MAKKVLVCSNAYPPNFVGGAELIAHYHALQMLARGCQVEVFAADASQSAPRYTMLHDTYAGLPVHRVHLHGDDFRADYENFFHPQVEAHFADVLRRFAPDVVHLHNIIGLSLGMIEQARAAGARVVLTVHDHWGFCLKSTLLRPDGSVCQNFSQCAGCLAYVDGDTARRIPIALRRDLFARRLAHVDWLISPSRYLAGAYIRAGIAPEKVQIIGYGMDLARLADVRPTRQPDLTRFTFTGYLGEHKGVLVLMEAMRLLSQRTDIQLQIVGTGHLDQRLRTIARDAGLENSVRFLGKIPNEQIASVLSNTDVLILPSVWPENQPVTILEALACGIPVLGSRLGGITEMIEDGVTGWLFDHGDAADLAQKMIALADTPKKITAAAAAARARPKETFAGQTEKILQLYDTPPPPGPLQTECSLVLCLGLAVEPAARDAIARFAQEEDAAGTRRLRFLMYEWATPAERSAAKLLWVTEPHVTYAQVRALTGNHSLLVPHTRPDLTQMFTDASSGAMYADADSALAWLRLFARRPQSQKQWSSHNARTLALLG